MPTNSHSDFVCHPVRQLQIWPKCWELHTSHRISSTVNKKQQDISLNETGYHSFLFLIPTNSPRDFVCRQLQISPKWVLQKRNPKPNPSPEDLVSRQPVCPFAFDGPSSTHYHPIVGVVLTRCTTSDGLIYII